VECPILYGKNIAVKIEEELKKQVEVQKRKLGRTPQLTTIVAAEDSASKVYLASQAKVAARLGIEFDFQKLPGDISQDNLEKEIQSLNRNQAVDGVLIQMPLPAHLDPKRAINFLSPDKDVEGLHPQNLGRLFFLEPKIIPPTVAGVMAMLEEIKIDLRGKEVVIVGHSEIVGKPLSLLLLNKLATTTVCHIGTSGAGHLEMHLKKAEILIVAVGKPRFIKGSSLKKGVVVIDVGINKENGKLVGDVDFETAKEKASFITPVPGGIGALTPVMLMRNLLRLTQ